MPKVVEVGPDMTPERFQAVLEAAGSPAAAEAKASWRAVVGQGVSPAFALAVFHHESNYGKLGICASYQTRSPGNTRSSRTGVGEVIQTERGAFVRYPSWEEGFRDLARRLVDPAFVYAQEGRETVEAIIPRWAPASDGNSPERYIQAVTEDLARFQEEVTMPLPIRVSFIPAGNPNRPGRFMRPHGITVHETANQSVGANAEMHRRFVHNGGGTERVSFHWVVDDHEAIQLLPHSEIAWHGGDGEEGHCNTGHIAIETCVNADGDWARTKDNLVELLVHLCRQEGIAVSEIGQHHDCSGKDCPHQIRAEGSWSSLIAQVQARPEVIEVPETGRHLGHGFLAYWRGLEQGLVQGHLRTLGYPITEEFDLGFPGDPKTYTVQLFERGGLIYEAGASAPWDVRCLTLDQLFHAREEARRRGLGG